MNRLLLLGILAVAVFTATAAYPAHPVFVNPSDISESSMDSFQAAEANVQLAAWYPKCHCCWYGRYGRVWCKWVRVHRCWRTGGWCR